jgi:type III secretion system FlhB-like substrate exporter
MDIGKAIPTKWYMAVAEVLTMVYKLKKDVG